MEVIGRSGSGQPVTCEGSSTIQGFSAWAGAAGATSQGLLRAMMASTRFVGHYRTRPDEQHPLAFLGEASLA